MPYVIIDGKRKRIFTEEQKLRRKEYARKNSEKLRLYRAKYYQEHKENWGRSPEEQKEYNRQWYLKNKSYFDRWREEHREHIRELSRIRSKTDKYKEKARLYGRWRGALIKKSGFMINKEIREAIFSINSYRCRHCGNDERLTIDHIVPFGRGGKHSLENVQPLCLQCNIRKGKKLESEIGFGLQA